MSAMLCLDDAIIAVLVGSLHERVCYLPALTDSWVTLAIPHVGGGVCLHTNVAGMSAMTTRRMCGALVCCWLSCSLGTYRTSTPS